MKSNLPSLARLMDRFNHLARIGKIKNEGVCRLALSDEDKKARDLLKKWMEDLNLEIQIDAVGNMIGLKKGSQELPPFFMGSHLDTVGTGGRFDGSLGVLAGLEVIQTLIEQELSHKRPVGLINFTNEEGVRFTPDMMGSYFLSGGIAADEIHQINSIDGNHNFGKELIRIGYHGSDNVTDFKAGGYLELHIEQGPVLENDEINIGAVTLVQGISWLEFIIKGQANHAGTTPMELRKDASFVASSIIQKARSLTYEYEGQVATAGLIESHPNLINVVPERVRFTVDLRNQSNAILREVEDTLKEFAYDISRQEGTKVTVEQLVRFDPVDFDNGVVEAITESCKSLNLSVKKMPSGAGHDAQMMAKICPTAMIFVPSKDGISHNPKEFTHEKDVSNGLMVLYDVVKKLIN